MGARRDDLGPDVVRITTAPESPGADMAHRQKRYMISMGFRTVFFVAAILVGAGWVRWVLVGAALLLPTIAVVMANSAGSRTEGSSLLGTAPGRRELGSGAPPPR